MLLIDFRYKTWVKSPLHALAVIFILLAVFTTTTYFAIERPDSSLLQDNAFLRAMNRDYTHLQELIQSHVSDNQGQWIVLSILLNFLSYVCRAELGSLNTWAICFAYGMPTVAVAISTKMLRKSACASGNMTLQTDEFFLVTEGIFAISVVTWEPYPLGKRSGGLA